MTSKLYHLANIRELLTKSFNDAELRILCFDVPDFQPVYHELAQNTGKAEIVAKLLEHAEKNLQIDTLLALARDHNLARYEEHGPYYIDNPIPTLQKHVIHLAKQLVVLTSPAYLTHEQQYQIALYWAELGRKESLMRFDLSNTDLRVVDLAGADLRVANLSKADLHHANLQNANLCEANLSRADLRGANLFVTDLRGADLQGADLSGADLRRAKLTETKIDNATVISDKGRLVWEIVNQGAVGRDLSMVDLSFADLNGVDLTKVNLTGASLTRIQLSMANLTGANLSGADLIRCDLVGANLSKVNLSEASLIEANLDYAHLSGANLTGVDLHGAKYNIDTMWPKGFNPLEEGAIFRE
jgi:uncharacterized protein YjbI with pentapeptide repeats